MIEPEQPLAASQPNQLLEGVPYADYAKLAGINAHGLMDVLRSPGAYRAGLAAPSSKPSPSMLTGILLEAALLEPDEFRRTVSVGRAKAENTTQTVITALQADKISAMVAAVRENAYAASLLAKVVVQPVVTWRDPVFETTCKARLDAVADMGGKRVCVDIKTARDASADGFARASAQYRYDLQAAHYLAAGAATGLYDAETFLFVVVQNTAPYSCFVYQAGEDVLARGRAWREHAMGLYVQCKAANQWPSEPAFATLGLPKWASWPDDEERLAQAEPEDMEPPDLD